MTSVESGHHLSSINTHHHLDSSPYISVSPTQPQNLDRQYYVDVDERISPENNKPARFEAFIMTGDHILSKTNTRFNEQSNGKVKVKSNFEKRAKKSNPSPTNNIVLHSPPNWRKSASGSPSSEGSDGQVVDVDEVDGRERSVAEEIVKEDGARAAGRHYVNTFEYASHDLHGFMLSTVVDKEKENIPHDKGIIGVEVNDPPIEPQQPFSEQQQLFPATSESLQEPISKNLAASADKQQQDSYSEYQRRSATPDDRYVWTVNAPVKNGAPQAKYSPSSPRKSAVGSITLRPGTGYHERLTEETIITDTTISEVTDTQLSTSFILPSPRTPRHGPQQNGLIHKHHPQGEVRTVLEGSKEAEPAADQPTFISTAQYRPTRLAEVEKSEEESLKISMEDSEEAPPPPPPLFASEAEQKPGKAFVHPESALDCMEIFPLDGLSLDTALRVFLGKVRLTGETQARQRVVDLFAMRYAQCNPNGFYSPDAAYAVVSAMLILNSDLHSQHRPPTTTSCKRFIANLKEIPACENLPDDELQRIYTSIRNEPLPMPPGSEEIPGYTPPPMEESVVVHTGFLQRKSCLETGGKRTGFGKRGWHRYYVIIRDLWLEFYKREPNGESEPAYFSLPLHHGYCVLASDYRKRKNVLRYRCVDESECLLQANNERDLQTWMLAINRTAALYSAPVSLPVGSQTIATRTFSKGAAVRPLYPSKKALLTLDEQLEELQRSKDRLNEEIRQLNTRQPESRAEAIFMSSQLNFFKNEMERCQVYLDILSSS